MRLVMLLLSGLCAAPLLASPPEALALALADCRVLPPDRARYVRYFDLTHIPPADRPAAAGALAFHVNSLSREPELVAPRPVGGGAVLAVDLRDYGWYGESSDPTARQFVFGRLNGLDAGEPYFHVVVEVDEGGKKVRRSAAAPWLPAAQASELIERTNSQVALLRADWFVNRTAIQAGREGHGYYDFLGLGRKQADFLRLIGADAKEARRLKLEIAASVGISGVTLNNRGLTRLQALTGGYWFSQDYKTSSDKQNTVRLLDGDTDPPQGDASEQYGVLPNRLFAYWLQNGQGERQDSAPDFIARDSKTTSNDGRVHIFLSCCRCHVEGLRPIDDYARRLFQHPVQLRSPDYQKFKRLRQLYLSDLPGQLAEDNARYAAALLACNGLTPAANARAFAAFWEQYADVPVSLGQAARELGCDERRLQAAVRAYATAQPFLDPVVASFAQVPPLAVRREHFEEVYPLMQKILGAVP